MSHILVTLYQLCLLPNIIIHITVLVGTKTAASNRILVDVDSMLVATRTFCRVLHALAQCQKVRKGKQNQIHVTTACLGDLI